VSVMVCHLCSSSCLFNRMLQSFMYRNLQHSPIEYVSVPGEHQ
jgi:hypothetical protein